MFPELEYLESAFLESAFPVLAFLELVFPALVFLESVFPESVCLVWYPVRCSLRDAQGCPQWCWPVGTGVATAGRHCPSLFPSPPGAGPAAAAAAKAAAKAAKYGKTGSPRGYPARPACCHLPAPGCFPSWG